MFLLYFKDNKKRDDMIMIIENFFGSLLDLILFINFVFYYVIFMFVLYCYRYRYSCNIS